MENLIKIKCHSCKDILTEGELRTHFLKPRLNQFKPTCFQCSQKAWRELRAKLKEREVKNI